MQMVYPVEFQTYSDVSGRALGSSLVDEVEDVDFHIIHPLVSISVEMSQHLGLLSIMCYLVEVPLDPLCQTVLGLADILFPTSCAGYQYIRLLLVQLTLCRVRYAMMCPSVFSFGQYLQRWFSHFWGTPVTWVKISPLEGSLDRTSRSRRLFGLR